MDDWAIPITHIPKPITLKHRYRSQIPRRIFEFLLKIALLGLFVLFLIFKIYLVLADLAYQQYLYISRYVLNRVKSKKRVVIVGGGYAGVYAAQCLEKSFDVTLIDAKEYFEFTPSRLRILVEPKHSYRVQLKHTSILRNTRVIAQPVHYVTQEGVETPSQWIPYDYLIITTGSRYREPSFPPIADSSLDSDCNAHILSARVDHIEKYSNLVQNSKRVLIIGGGTVGVELAGEIIEKFSDKEVTLIHGQQKLMPRSPARAIRYTETFCESRGIRTVLGERIVQQSGLYFKTDAGTILEADLAFVCTGIVPNSELLKYQFADHLNSFGFVKVNEFMQLKGHSNIFVAGDLTDVPNQEEKLCQTAYHEIRVVIANLFNVENKRPLIPYVPSSCPMLISLGKYDGILTYKSWTFTGFVPAVMKEFVEWKEMVFYWSVAEHFNLNEYLKSHYKEERSSDDWIGGHAHII